MIVAAAKVSDLLLLLTVTYSYGLPTVYMYTRLRHISANSIWVTNLAFWMRIWDERELVYTVYLTILRVRQTPSPPSGLGLEPKRLLGAWEWRDVSASRMLVWGEIGLSWVYISRQYSSN